MTSGGFVRIAWVASDSDRAGFSTSSLTNQTPVRARQNVQDSRPRRVESTAVMFWICSGRWPANLLGPPNPTFLVRRRADTVRSGVANFQSDLPVPTPPALASKLRFLGRSSTGASQTKILLTSG
jgi:hypothetical protein